MRCTLGKRVSRAGDRCPDCKLAARRHQLKARVDDDAERLRRIETSAPPASTIDGALRRLRDGKEEGDALCIGPTFNAMKEPCPDQARVQSAVTRRCEACIRERRRRRAAEEETVDVIFDGSKGQSLIGDRPGGSSLPRN